MGFSFWRFDPLLMITIMLDSKIIPFSFCLGNLNSDMHYNFGTVVEFFVFEPQFQNFTVLIGTNWKIK